MTKPKLFVALPTTHGVMQSQFLPTALELFKNRTIDLRVDQYIDPYGVLARNTAATDFLDTDYTHLLFLDADMILKWAHIERMLSHDVDIVGALYCKKTQGKMQWVCNALPDRPPVDSRGLLPLKHIGTGCLLVKRGVFLAMLEKYRDEMDYLEAEIDKQRWDFFPMRIVDRRMISEDWFFCDRARALGYTVYGDTKVLLGHIGTVVFPLDTQIEESKSDMDSKTTIKESFLPETAGSK